MVIMRRSLISRIPRRIATTRQGTPEFMKWFDYEEGFYEDSPPILRQYQNRNFLVDYAKGTVLHQHKIEVYDVGKYFRKKRISDKYTIRFHINQLYSYIIDRKTRIQVIPPAFVENSPSSEQQVGAWDLGHQQHNYSHGRSSDFEAVNMLMRRFSSENVIDAAVGFGALLGLSIVVFSPRSSPHFSKLKRE